MFADLLLLLPFLPTQVGGQDVETSAEAGGYYRLAFGGEETTCIGYHATEDIVQASREEYTESQKVMPPKSSGACIFGELANVTIQEGLLPSPVARLKAEISSVHPN